MCVVLICPPKQRPDLTILRACHAANPHGAGVAWREKRHIHWRKASAPVRFAEKAAAASIAATPDRGPIVVWESTGTEPRTLLAERLE